MSRRYFDPSIRHGYLDDPDTELPETLSLEPYPAWAHEPMRRIFEMLAPEADQTSARPTMVPAASDQTEPLRILPSPPRGGVPTTRPILDWRFAPAYAQPERPNDYSPDRSGWHDYTAGPNVVCPAPFNCSAEMMADQLARFAVPGQDPAKPTNSGDTSMVYDPRFQANLPGGYVKTKISDDGLEVENTTRPLHALHDGKIKTWVYQDADGTWYAMTRGIGNNVVPFMNRVNQGQGPQIFDAVHQQMLRNIKRYHGQ